MFQGLQTEDDAGTTVKPVHTWVGMKLEGDFFQ